LIIGLIVTNKNMKNWEKNALAFVVTHLDGYVENFIQIFIFLFMVF